MKEIENSISSNENRQISRKEENTLEQSTNGDEDFQLELALVISEADYSGTSKNEKDLKSSKHQSDTTRNFGSQLKKHEKSDHNGREKQYESQNIERNEDLLSLINQTHDKHMELALAMSSADEKERNIRPDCPEPDSYRADTESHNHLTSENERLSLLNKKLENELAMMKKNENMKHETELENKNIQKRIRQQIKFCIKHFDMKPYKEVIFGIKLWSDCYNTLLVPRKKLDNIYENEKNLLANDTSLIILELCIFLEKIDIESKSSFLSYIRPHIKVISEIYSEFSTEYLFDIDKHVVDSTVDCLHPIFLKEFERVQVRGDGNCLWNSISIARFGDYSFMESLRLLTAGTLIEYKHYFESHLEEQRVKFGYRHGLNYEQLINASLELSVWGDEYHLLALSLALHRPIISYGSFEQISSLREDMSYEELKTEYEREDQINHMLYIGDSDDKLKYPICIYYNGENHYCAVLPRNRTVYPPMPKTQLFPYVIDKEKQGLSRRDTYKFLHSERHVNSHHGSAENIRRNHELTTNFAGRNGMDTGNASLGQYNSDEYSRINEKNERTYDSTVGNSLLGNEMRESKPIKKMIE